MEQDAAAAKGGGAHWGRGGRSGSGVVHITHIVRIYIIEYGERDDNDDGGGENDSARHSGRQLNVVILRVCVRMNMYACVSPSCCSCVHRDILYNHICAINLTMLRVSPL